MKENTDQKKFLQLKQLERKIQQISNDVDAAIVEGYSDRRALQKLGFEGRIFQSAERTTEDLAEDVARASKTVVILTDFDSHGKEQNKEISQELNSMMTVDFAARKQFGKILTSQGRRDIEDVRPLFDSWQDKFVEATLDRLFF